MILRELNHEWWTGSWWIDGFGPINPEQDEPYFHAEWEKRVLAFTLAMGATGSWNIDTSRHMRENMDPGKYLTLSYYEIWMEGLQKLLTNNQLASVKEIETGTKLEDPAPVKQVLQADKVSEVLANGTPYDRPGTAQPLFSIGDQVTTRNINPSGHTRLARYLRGHVGEIVEIHGYHVFPDAHAHGLSDDAQWLYSVRFSARELWGEDARDGDFVHADLWEPYFVQSERTG